jgi:hypothetical protein
MMRSAARRNEKADYRLELIITAKPQAAAGYSEAASEDQHYDATGMVPCAQYRDQTMGQCDVQSVFQNLSQRIKRIIAARPYTSTKIDKIGAGQKPKIVRAAIGI